MAERNKDWNCNAMIFKALMDSFPVKRTAGKLFEVVQPLEDGSTLKCCLSISYAGFGIPYGADRQLLLWLLRRALKTREANVTWKILLESLGPSPTAPEKKALYFAARRIGVASAHWMQKDGFWNGFTFASAQVSSWDEIPAVGAAEEFTGETEFILDIPFLAFVENAKRRKRVSPPASVFPGYPVQICVEARAPLPFRAVPIIDRKLFGLLPRDITKLERI